MNSLQENRIEGLIREKLCKKGEAYRKRRMAAGEKSSAYLSGRAVKVCKGQMSGKKKKKTNEIIDEITESLRDWFKKEDWVRIDTQGNIAGKCGTMKKGKATTRCLPRKKAQSLSKAERKSTTAKKVRGSKKGKQFVKNTKKAKVKLEEIDYDSIFRVEAYLLTDLSNRDQGGILSDIRSLPGVTIVGSRDVKRNPTKEKSILSIKVDPYPFTKMDDVSAVDSVDYITDEVRKIAGVKAFKILQRS
tara:strand:+ start:3531 stop:4268 length:738 start_codon:yes stop_codon:yes gene_type:complete